MRRTRGWQCTTWLFVVLVLLALASTSAEAQVTAGKAKVDRLVMGLITPYLDYWRPWINGTPDQNIQHDPTFEWLVEIDPETGKYMSWLGRGRYWPCLAHQRV